MDEQQASKQTLTQALRALQKRGVGEHVFPDFFAMDPAVILDTCRWFDEQGGRVGPGVLVEELRAGGRKPARRAVRRSVADEQRDYQDQIFAWLREHFPTLVDDGPSRFPHPAAIVAVIHLHYRYGKGSLDVREHGPEIRAAVKAWDERFKQQASRRTVP